MRATAGALLLFSLSTPPSMAAAWIGWDLDCDSQEVRVGDPDHAWLVLDGFSPADAEGGRTIQNRAGVLVLLGAPSAETTIYVEARTDGKRAALRASLNERELGERTYRKRREIQGFAVPPGAARRGVNVLRLEVRAPGRKDAARLAVSRVGVGPLRCPGRSPAAIPVDAKAPMTLTSSSLVLAPFASEGGTPDRVAISFATRHPATAVTVSCWTPTTVDPLASLAGGPRGRVQEFLPLPGNCVAPGGLALTALGPAAATDVRIDVARGGIGWRGRVRAQQLALLLTVATVGLVVVVRLRTRGLPREPLAAGQTLLWLDAGWIVFAAAIPRIVFSVLSLPLDATNPTAASPGLVALLLALSAATAGLVYLTTLPLFGRLAAWWAGLLFAFYLGSIVTFAQSPGGVVFTFLALSGLALITRRSARFDPGAGEARRNLRLIGGVTLGLALLLAASSFVEPAAAGPAAGNETASSRSDPPTALGPIPEPWVRRVLDERDAVRAARWTTSWNGQYGLVAALAVAGLAGVLLRPRYWPLAAWLPLNLLLTLPLHSAVRYREVTVPVLMAFAGGAVAAAVDRLTARRRAATG